MHIRVCVRASERVQKCETQQFCPEFGLTIEIQSIERKSEKKNCSVLNCCCFLFFLITLLTLSKKREKKSSLIPVSHSSISLQSSEKHKLTRFELSTLVEHDLPTQTYMYMKKCVLMYASVYVCTYVCVGVDVWNLECRLVWYLNILTLVFCQDNL